MPDLLVPVTLISGPEELLVSRAVAEVVAAARASDPAADPPVEIQDLATEEVGPGLLMDLMSPSMFGGIRVFVLRGVGDLDESLRDDLISYVAAPDPDIVLVLHHAGGIKGKKLVDAVKAGGARVVTCPAVDRPSERMEFVQAEVRSAGRQITAGACRLVVETVGADLRALAQAVAQMVAETTGTLDEEKVGRSHRGRAETRGFDVADAAVAGDLPSALALLRRAVETGTAEVLVSSALAGSLRDLGRVRGVSGSAAQAAKELGMPPWKVEKLGRAARGWSDDGLALALRAAADADEGVKGGAVVGSYALERALLTICEARHLAVRR